MVTVEHHEQFHIRDWEKYAIAAAEGAKQEIRHFTIPVTLETLSQEQALEKQSNRRIGGMPEIERQWSDKSWEEYNGKSEQRAFREGLPLFRALSRAIIAYFFLNQ